MNLDSSIKNFHRTLKNALSFVRHTALRTTRTTCTTSTLINHILTNTQECISQSGIIDTAVSDHSMVYCTRKISRAKYNKHKEMNFRSLKNYSDFVYKDFLEKVSIPNYDSLDNLHLGYSDLMSTLESVINVVAPVKTVRIKNTTREWFDGDIAE